MRHYSSSSSSLFLLFPRFLSEGLRAPDVRGPASEIAVVLVLLTVSILFVVDSTTPVETTVVITGVSSICFLGLLTGTG